MSIGTDIEPTHSHLLLQGRIRTDAGTLHWDHATQTPVPIYATNASRLMFPSSSSNGVTYKRKRQAPAGKENLESNACIKSSRSTNGREQPSTALFHIVYYIFMPN